MVRSGLLLLTRTVGCRTLLWYPVCLLVLANHRRRVAGCLANKLHSLLYTFWFLPTDEARGISGANVLTLNFLDIVPRKLPLLEE